MQKTSGPFTHGDPDRHPKIRSFDPGISLKRQPLTGHMAALRSATVAVPSTISSGSSPLSRHSSRSVLWHQSRGARVRAPSSAVVTATGKLGWTLESMPITFVHVVVKEGNEEAFTKFSLSNASSSVEVRVRHVRTPLDHKPQALDAQL